MNMNKKLTVFLGAMTLYSMAASVGAGEAQAAIFSFSLNGTYTAGGAITGTFDYDTVSNAYSNYSFLSSATTLNPAVGALANNFTYSSASSEVNTNFATSTSATGLYLSSADSNAFPYRDLVLAFTSGLNTLTNIGDTTTLIVDNARPTNGSYEQYGSSGQTLTAAISGGTITRTAVPEPLTILGAATAVGFGAAFKRRTLKNNKKG